MSMKPVRRRITYKLYPSARQIALLERMCRMLCRLYNAALEERIDCYRKTGRSIGFNEQCRSLTLIRADDPDYAAIHVHAGQVVLKRLQRAFENFFRRVREGAEEPGFPRFKKAERFPGFGYKEHGNGFRFSPKFDADGNWKHGTLYLAGIGEMAVRGEARTVGQKICECSIMRKADGWFLSLVVECHPQRECGARDGGLDWGIETYATIAHEDAVTGAITFEAFENDRFWQAAQDEIKEAQRALDKASRGKKRTRLMLKAKNRLARKSRKLSNRCKNRSHVRSNDLVADHGRLFTETLSIANMTASAKGTVEKPGKMVKQKAGLNRETLDTAPAGLVKMACYKAEEAGCKLLFLNTRRHKPSQTCPACRRVEKKELSERQHCCDCGYKASRDEAAALTMLRIGRELHGREPAEVAKLAA